MSDPIWYAVRTEVKSEPRAAHEIGRRGFEAFYPVWRKELRHHRTKKWMMKHFALFPRYVFVRLADPAHCGVVDDLEGVDGVLRNDGWPVPVEDKIIEQTRRAIDSGAFDEMRGHVAGRIVPGEQVKIAEGPLAGLAGPLASVRNSHTAKILISMFNREVSVGLELANLSKQA